MLKKAFLLLQKQGKQSVEINQAFSKYFFPDEKKILIFKVSVIFYTHYLSTYEIYNSMLVLKDSSMNENFSSEAGL